MNHTKSIAIKALMIFQVVWIILPLNGVSFASATFVAVALLIASYVLGDLMILPNASNTMSTISDLALATLVTWGMLVAVGYVEALGE